MTSHPPPFNLKALADEDLKKGCVGKRRYYSKNAARDDAKRIEKETGRPRMTVYRCAACHRFHLTSIAREDAPNVKSRLRANAGMVLVMEGNAAT